MANFTDDIEWVKFQCMRLAIEYKPYTSLENVIDHAEKMFNYIMPKAVELELHIAEEKEDAAKVRKK